MAQPRLGFILIFAGLAVLVVGAVVIAQLGPPPERSPASVRIGSGFDAALALPRDRINQVLSDAADASKRANDSGVWRKSLSENLFTLAFILGALTTIVVGLQKISQTSSGKDKLFSIAIGLLSAISAASTASAKYLQTEADKKFDCADSIHEDIIETRDNVRNQPNPDEAEDYLRELTQRVARCAS